MVCDEQFLDLIETLKKSQANAEVSNKRMERLTMLIYMETMYLIFISWAAFMAGIDSPPFIAVGSAIVITLVIIGILRKLLPPVLQGDSPN